MRIIYSSNRRNKRRTEQFREQKAEIHSLKLEIDRCQKELSRRGLALASLADCVRDGIEKNYGSWDDWQKAACEVIRNSAASRKELSK